MSYIQYMIQIAIIHSQPIYSQALATLLEVKKQLRVVTVSKHLRELIASQNESIDVILWHISSHHTLPPGMSVLKEHFPLAKVIALTENESNLYSGLLVNLGISMTICTTAQVQELYKAIIQVAKQYVPPPSSNHVEEPSAPHPLNQHAILSPRERVVLQLICQGLTDQQIALKLGISRRTVDGHRIRMRKKLMAPNTAVLVRKAVENDLIPLP